MDRMVNRFLPDGIGRARPLHRFYVTRLAFLPLLSVGCGLLSMTSLPVRAGADTLPSLAKAASTGREAKEPMVKTTLPASLVAVRAGAEGTATNVDLTLVGASTPALEG